MHPHEKLSPSRFRGEVKTLSGEQVPANGELFPNSGRKKYEKGILGFKGWFDRGLKFKRRLNYMSMLREIAHQLKTKNILKEVKTRLSIYNKDGINRWTLKGVKHPFWLIIFIGAIFVSAIALFISDFSDFSRIANRQELEGLLCFYILTLLLQNLVLDIYGRGGVSFEDSGTLALGYLFGPAAAMVMGLTGVIRYLSGKMVHLILFDIANLALAIGIGTHFFLLIPHQPLIIKIFIVGSVGTVYYILMTILLSIDSFLIKGSSSWREWKERYIWLLPYTPAVGCLAGGLILGYQRIGILGLAVFTLPALFILISARQYLAKTKEGVEETREANEKLRQANQKLAESGKYFRSLIEDAADAILVFDERGRISYGSPALERLLKRPLDQIIGERVLRLINRKTIREVSKSLQNQLNGREEVFEINLFEGDEERILEIAARKSLDVKRPEVVITVRDVTLRRKIEQERTGLEQQLHQSQKMEAIGQLAGGVAHDFNNLLTVIMGCSEVLSFEMEADDPRREEVGEILKAAARAGKLTKQLLAFSRKQVFEAQALDLNDTLQEIQKMLERLLGSDIKLQTELANEGAMVYADPGQMEQILVNLSVNARDAIESGEQGGGIIKIATSKRQVREGEIALLSGGDYLVLSVSDNGTGMDEETRKKIFEPFFTTKASGQGTGLGLATVYGIVKQSKGAIEVKSKLGVGTTFLIYLPLYAVIAETKTIDTEEADELASGTVLVVDDEDAIRRLASTVLEGRGYRVLTARDGQDALELSRAYGRDIDLLLTDIVMPEMTGTALALQLKEERPTTKALFMSGNVNEINLEEEKDSALLRKPFFASALLDAVREALKVE